MQSAIAAIRLYQPMVNLSVNEEGTFHMGHQNYTLKLHIHEHRSRNREHIELQWVRDCKIWQDRHATPVELFKREGVKFPDTKAHPERDEKLHEWHQEHHDGQHAHARLLVHSALLEHNTLHAGLAVAQPVRYPRSSFSLSSSSCGW